jgi:diacylglycerol kinase
VSVKARLRSFGYAFKGLRTLVLEQTNARIHLLATVSVIGLGLNQGLARLEWVAILLCVAMVWCAEALNTSLEYLCDAVHPEHHQLIERAKDVAAAGVLVCAAISVAVAALVFFPL